MPHYLRLLNNPVLEQGKANQSKTGKPKGNKTHLQTNGFPNGITISFKLSCTTDLGDAYYDGDLEIDIYLLASDISTEPVAHGQVSWRRGMRVLSETATLQGTQKLDMTKRYWLCLEAREMNEDGEPISNGSRRQRKGYDVLCAKTMPEIISISAPVLSSHHSKIDLAKEDIDQHVLRRLLFPMPDRELSTKSGYLELLMYEEMGDSIARHIWDAGLALLASCTTRTTADVKHTTSRRLLTPFFERKDRRQLQILELGSGCGIIGLGLARVIPDAHIILTDLPEAMPILKKNIIATRRLGLAPRTTIDGLILDWNDALIDAQPPTNENVLDMSCLRPDLVLVSDCVYNPNSFKPLIATLVQVVKQAHKQNPRQECQLDVLLTYKIRHDSESRFFQDLQDAGFEVLMKEEVIFPDRTRIQIGLAQENAEIYAFALKSTIP